jgi:NodT family efflux transporter outer membrane factor (OMF) lipoprotein
MEKNTDMKMARINLNHTLNWISFFLLFTIFSVVFNGCKPVGPDYIPPENSLPDAWNEQIISNLNAPSSNLESWWQVFNDPVLNDLISKAKEENKNLKIAYTNVMEARANLSGVSGKKLPSSLATLGVSESKLSDDGSFAQLAPENGFVPQSLFSVGVNATWEIDVFGRVRRSVEAAGYEYQASIDDYYDVMVVLLADVAISYADLRLYQELIINTELNSELQQQSLELAQFRYDAGLSSYLDVLQAKANLAETKSIIPIYKTEEMLAINRLAVLLGTTSDSLSKALFEFSDVPAARANIGSGVPADLLRQRPDIRAAERTIAKNNAKIGVSKADLYPTFALSGFLGFDSRSVTNLFTIPGLNWGVSLPVGWQVFNRKRIKANIEINEQRTQHAILNYENVVLQAYAEVENAVISYNNQKDRLNYLNEAVNMNKEAVSLVSVQYNTGLTDFQNVLDTERSLLRQQNNRLNSEAMIMVNLIQLYKSLGGGWVVPPDSVSLSITAPDSIPDSGKQN